MLDFPLYGLFYVLVRFLVYLVEVVYQSSLYLLMLLFLYSILVLNLHDFFMGSSGHGCFMKKHGVLLSFP